MERSNSSVTAQAAQPAAPRRHLMLALKLLVTLGAITYLLARQPLDEIARQLALISPLTLALGIAVQALAVIVGAVRWRVLLRAYGARDMPRLAQLIKVYFVGQFYNVYVPGAVGGDLLRGVVTRRAFAGGATSAVSVVFVERALGASGVLTLTACATALFAAERFGYLVPYCLLGVLAVLAGVVALAQGPRMAKLTFLPAVVRRVLAGVPPLTHVASFAIAYLLSLCTQTFVVLCGHVFMRVLDPRISLADSFVAMPLAGAAGYFPVTIAGIGPRDWVVKTLYAQLGASDASATATAFAFLFATLATALVGGLWQLARPIDVDDGQAIEAQQ
jgi:uncharacterized membrane protein YbhN (UPF0104 family)